MKKSNILFIITLMFLCVLSSCKEKETKPPTPDPNPDPDEEVIPPTDPEVAKTIGFFLEEWKQKNFVIPDSKDTVISGSPTAEVTIDASKVISKVTPNMYGQNSVSFVENLSDDPVLMGYLKDLKPGIIRFPGGSRSDAYFWNRSFQDKPADAPDSIYDGNNKEIFFKYNYWYGKDNPQARANLQDYYNLLNELGSQGIITVNYGYARYGLSPNPVAQAAHLAAEWVRYDNGRTKYWEIGNENHGGWEHGYQINVKNNKDGQPQIINGQLYAQHAKVFIDSMRKAANEIGKKIYIGVGIVEEPIIYPQWNQRIMNEMKLAGTTADFYIIHHYYLKNNDNTYGKIIQSAVDNTREMAGFVKSEYTKYGEAEKPIALTEYNIFAVGSAGSMQQVSFVNGMHTTIVLGEAIKNKLGSAIRWDIANGWDNGADHGMFNKGDEPGVDKWNPRPVFYYMYYFQKMFGDRMVQSTSSKQDIISYASSFSSGEKGVVLVNKGRTSELIKINNIHSSTGAKYYWYELTGGTDNDDFSRKVFINNAGPLQESGGPLNYKSLKGFAGNTNNGILINMPPRSTVFLVISKK